MKGKNLLITKEAHKQLKLFCTEKDHSMTQFASLAILEYIKYCKIEEENGCEGK